MFQINAQFRFQHFETDPVTLIGQIINQWRYNGQIIGREVAITYHPESEASFWAKVSTPEQTSLMPENNSLRVTEALQQAGENGIEFAGFEIVGRDYQAEQTCESMPTFQMLYTTHLDSCSPVYCGETFTPIPLYQATGKNDELGEQLIKWQEDWQACDQLQMNGSTLEQQALLQISELNSLLAQQGIALCRTLEQIKQIPTYYYLYRLGKNKHEEHHRKCPNCGGEWKLAEPLHQILHFKCDKCRLVSNLSWELL